MKILIIVPVYNEQDNISNVIDDLNKDLPQVDILIINDGSVDKSLDIIINKNVEYISLPFNLGYSIALQTGYKYALENKYDYIIQFDGDGQHIAKEANKMLTIAKEQKGDIVIGSRFMEQNIFTHPFLRKIGRKILSFLIKLICNRNISDPTSGFQVINKKTLKYLCQIQYFPQFSDANLIIDIILKNYNVIETPVIMRQRQFGRSMYDGILAPAKYIIMIFYSIVVVIVKHFLTIIRRNKFVN
tara:strand:- start:2958 stop:3689 length:732 start_codon:yes stop_codon:yes gene_type:complete